MEYAPPTYDRPEYQRRQLSLLMRALFNDLPTIMPQLDSDALLKIRSQADTYRNTDIKFCGPQNELWASAYAVAHFAGYTNLQRDSMPKVPDFSLAGLEAHTYYGSRQSDLQYTWSDAVDSIIYMPLSLVHSIYDDDKGERFPLPQSLDDIADFMDREDFREIVEDALLTSNGVWNGFSLTVTRGIDGTTLGQGYDIRSMYEYTDDQVQFSADVLASLRGHLKKHNHPSESDSSSDRTPSGGCPARYNHVKLPRPEDQEFAVKVSEFYDIPVDELVTPIGRKSPAQESVDFIVRFMRAYADKLAEEATPR